MFAISSAPRRAHFAEWLGIWAPVVVTRTVFLPPFSSSIFFGMFKPLSLLALVPSLIFVSCTYMLTMAVQIGLIVCLSVSIHLFARFFLIKMIPVGAAGTCAVRSHSQAHAITVCIWTIYQSRSTNRTNISQMYHFFSLVEASSYLNGCCEAYVRTGFPAKIGGFLWGCRISICTVQAITTNTIIHTHVITHTFSAKRCSNIHRIKLIHI